MFYGLMNTVSIVHQEIGSSNIQVYVCDCERIFDMLHQHPLMVAIEC